MVLHLIRQYHPEGTNGSVLKDGKLICFCIELPWVENIRRISCIPEGKYELRIRYSPKNKWHLQVMNVPNRDFILFHPANDALKELNGCIAPVMQITGYGKGIYSRQAFELLKAVVYPELEKKKTVFIEIQKKE